MITRLQVTGFKNLIDVDIRFGEFTCIAGPNGSGKSNLFDAIQFLSLCASKTVHEAAAAIRGEGNPHADASSLFWHGEDLGKRRISFRVEMLVPNEARDDLNQIAKATYNFLTYELELGEGSNTSEQLPIVILKEVLSYIPVGKAKKNLLFAHKPAWRDSVIQSNPGGRREFFISTEEENGKILIKRHQDGGSRGKPNPVLASQLPRTVLSTANASESPTALCAKREMESWRMLALEASSLRLPDSFNAPSRMDSHGRHMPATLNRLLQKQADPERLTSRIANRLTELVEDVHQVALDKDPVRQAFSIYVSNQVEDRVPAMGLSDGTLRFLALAILEEDPDLTGVICLEEPENGIHPKRISAMIELLRDIAVDTEEPIGEDNPLRQVIINTHSPLVVSEVPEDCLVMAVGWRMPGARGIYVVPGFAGLSGTWRAEEGGLLIPKGEMLAYLNPTPERLLPLESNNRQRVAERADMQGLFPFYREMGE